MQIVSRLRCRCCCRYERRHLTSASSLSPRRIAITNQCFRSRRHSRSALRLARARPLLFLLGPVQRETGYSGQQRAQARHRLRVDAQVQRRQQSAESEHNPPDRLAQGRPQDPAERDSKSITAKTVDGQTVHREDKPSPHAAVAAAAICVRRCGQRR